jgi:hypothetical protein
MSILYLIQFQWSEIDIGFPYILAVLIVMVIIVTFSYVFTKLSRLISDKWDLLLPPIQFMWGNEISRLNKAEKTRQFVLTTIFATIGLGIIVGVLSNIIARFL